MVGYVIVAHKSDDQGKFYWNKKVEFELFIFRANQNIFQNQLEEEYITLLIVSHKWIKYNQAKVEH